MPRSFPAIRRFLNNEAAGGIVLMGVALLAIVIANSPAAPFYFATLNRYILGLSVLHWINDALMAVFFLLIGLEIKREFLDGELSSWSRRSLPGFAALGGMLAPALIYVAFNLGTPETLRGWAIPAATDIAFALGVLSLLGPRVPVSIKIFLMALAILDDLGAVIIIAVFYTANLNSDALLGALAILGVLVAFNAFGIKKLTAYLVLGAVLWFLVLKSGVHATLAGVALALTIPLKTTPTARDDVKSPLRKLEHVLHPWVAFMIIPIFGFANAGVSFANIGPSALFEPLPMGIVLGLFVGKQIGVFGFSWMAIRFGLAEMPPKANWTQIYGVALLCGIGFTMSLFIGLLAFPDSQLLQDETKIGVLAGSLISGTVGWLILRFAPSGNRPKAQS